MVGCFYVRLIHNYAVLFRRQCLHSPPPAVRQSYLVRHPGPLASCYILNQGCKIYRTIILPAVLYGRETWPLTLREERRLRVFENRVLRRVFGPKREEVTGEWRKLHNEEMNDLYVLLTQYCAGGKIETNEMGRACGAYGGG